MDPPAARRLRARARRRRAAVGLPPLIFTAQADEDALAAQEHLLATHTVDGLVLTDIDYHDARVVALAGMGVPFVAFGRAEVDEAHDWVDVDGQAGTRLAVEHVVTAGCTPVAFLGWPIGSATGDRRAAGYREALEGAGLPLNTDLDVRCADDIGDANAAAGRLLDLPERPAAIVAVSDTLAAGACTRRSSAGSSSAVTWPSPASTTASSREP